LKQEETLASTIIGAETKNKHHGRKTSRAGETDGVARPEKSPPTKPRGSRKASDPVTDKKRMFMEEQQTTNSKMRQKKNRWGMNNRIKSQSQGGGLERDTKVEKTVREKGVKVVKPGGGNEEKKGRCLDLLRECKITDAGGWQKSVR